ncbi:golvesin C-terminal-like domain-containing protein [Streptomyces sp. NPDC001571]
MRLHRPTRTARVPLLVSAALAVVAGLLQGSVAWAGQAEAGAPPPAGSQPNTVAPEQRADVLGKDWKNSTDRAWTTAGDSTGFHVLVADGNTGYTWRTVASLSEPGLETDQWIGNACVTGSGKRAVAVYAPRAFTNRPELFDRGAFAAVVDLESGKVTKLALNASLAYFDPGCGVGENAVVTQASSEAKGEQTQLQTVDATSGTVVSTSTVDGQATSAIPMGKDVVAAAGPHVIKVAPGGKAQVVATTHGTATRLHPDADGNVTFLEPAPGGTVHVQHLQGHTVTTLAEGGAGQVGLAQGAAGKVFVTGRSKSAGKLPHSVLRLASAPAQSELSTDGRLAVVQSAPQHLADKVASPLRAGTGTAEPVDIKATATGAGKPLGFTVTTRPTAAQTATGAKPSPLLPFIAGGRTAVKKALVASGAKSAAAGDSAGDPVDGERSCSVPRNDVNTQVYQPTPAQVEWAADMAIRGLLTSDHISRPANWHNSGLPAWSPQGMFPPRQVAGGGRIPAQVMLGILTQESNLWQASSHAEPGEYGNPLIGNFYGTNIYPGTTGYDPNRVWKIDWDKADCGYGIGQATDGMRLAGHPKPGESLLPPDQQRAVALDYATGIAYSVRILQDKWNELHTAGTQIKLNDDDAARPENWFAAVWDYNGGLNPRGSNADDPSAWGLGWANNPSNPKYPMDRGAFLDNNHYADAAKPQNWSYEEKVMGWGAFPIDTGHSYDDNGNLNKGNTHGFAAAWWVNTSERTYGIKPPATTFCDTTNGCDPLNPPVCHTVACYNQHWFNHDVTWKNCGTKPTVPGGPVGECGNEYLTYKTVRGEPGDAHPKLGPCDSGALPSGTVLVDDEPDGAPQNRCATRGWSSNGSFSWEFRPDDMGRYEAKEDLHQIGGGFGGHYWFSHARQPNNWDNYLTTSGTWTPHLDDHIYRIQAFVPYPSHTTKSAHYEITTKDGKVRERVVDQSKANNDWVTVGYFQLGSNAKVSLTNVTGDATSGDLDVAYDALAFVPVAGTYEHHTFDAAAIFESNQNLDTDTPWLMNTPMRTRQTIYDWAHSRTTGGPTFDSRGRLVGLSNFQVCNNAAYNDLCLGSNVSTAVKAWGADVEKAGTDPNNHPSQSDWLGFAIPAPPATIDEHTFDDDRSYKIRTHIDTSYVVGPDGKIIPGSEELKDSGRTGNTEIAPFARDFIQATVKDYGSLGVTLPDLSFDAKDGNVTGQTTHVANPLETGVTPGQAYRSGQQPTAIDSTGTCLTTKYVSGGSIGYRPLDEAPNTDAQVSAWVGKLKSLADQRSIPAEVADTAGDIYSLFFRKPALDSGGNPQGSLFNMAPPIWQNVSMGFCAGGTVKSTAAANIDDTPATGLVYQSYMPNLYLYLDGHMVDQNGRPANGPVQRGDFRSFSNLPLGDDHHTGYGSCGTEVKGNGGNPWSLKAVPSGFPGGTPSIPMFCDDGSHASS